MVNSYFNGTPINPPDELTEYLICERMGWTITELYDQPDEKVQKFIQIMRLQDQKRKQ